MAHKFKLILGRKRSLRARLAATLPRANATRKICALLIVKLFLTWSRREQPGSGPSNSRHCAHAADARIVARKSKVSVQAGKRQLSRLCCVYALLPPVPLGSFLALVPALSFCSVSLLPQLLSVAPSTCCQHRVLNLWYKICVCDNQEIYAQDASFATSAFATRKGQYFGKKTGFALLDILLTNGHLASI
jgi:hypothetical protein